MIKTPHFLAIGPLIGVLTYFISLHHFGLSESAAITAGITLLTVIWWVTEALPIPITSLVPFALLPIFGVLTHQEASSALGSHVILLLMGAFMLSKSLERSGVHRRLAILMVNAIGAHSKKRLVLGFMIATALLSMWISNTATILIMLPIALAVLSQVDEKSLKVALILGIAYAASVGGIGTLIGTPPNVIFAGIYEAQSGQEFSFLRWMLVGIPCVIIAIPLISLWLTRHLKGPLSVDLPLLGNWEVQELRTLAVFGLAVLAWVTRSAPFGGWSDALGISNAGDSTVALAAVVVMFMVPNGRGERLLDWKTAVDIPWGMLLLFAGGIALAKGFTASGLSQVIGDGLSSFSEYPLLITLLLLCLSVTYLTEIISNTATATLLMPILYLVALNYGVDPAILMVPAAMAASCAFMLPVATAPNAIAYGTGEIEIKDMVKEGAVLSFAVSSMLGLVTYVLLVHVL
ncbi:SLC13 family permease [Glaciecola sp. XM2]|uniref:SLC13 family permease n=1 Tax=Glaciecola sp. XM2 TaxID=1914931 RepID=UPI001BDF4D78|nr:SLC13 family permease [Glaciecola sp. XM2]MBT1449662.1 SLC13 family permease [Glaciecola sp. XM2]